MNKMIVVESAAKTKTIRQFLRGEYSVIACGGHIVDLPDDDLGINVEDHFEYRVEPIVYRGTSKVERVRDQMQDADEIYLATDPDREGEAIAADLMEYCVPEGVPAERIEFNAIVYHAVKEALETPRSIDEKRVESQRARRALDRLIGFVLSAMSQFDPDGPGCPSVGRVLAPAVSLVVDREREIREFEPRKYWTLHALLSWDGEELEATLEGEPEDFDAAREGLETLQETGDMTVVQSRENPEDEQNPLPPYATDSLQDEADFLLGFTPERTMGIAQELYQGVEIDGSPRALITYMRTDSTRVSPTGLNLAKKALKARDDFEEADYRGRTWQPQGAEQDAHEAIRPTSPEDPEVFPENLEGKLDEDHYQLYRLIYFRFLCSQMQPAVYHTTELDLEADGLRGSARGSRLLKPGFLKCFRRIRPEYGREDVEVPALDAGTVLTVERAWPEPEQTHPPARYREGSLVSELKRRGIGRPSTYGDILSKIKRGRGGYGYVNKVRGQLQPTERGENLTDYLRDRYHQVIDYEYTARMEEELERIEKGQDTYEHFLREEFSWLQEPYREVSRKGWLSGDRPTPAQVEYLKNLEEETGEEVPEAVFESKQRVSQWIDRLQEMQMPVVKLSEIHRVDVGGVECFRFHLFFNRPLPDEEKKFLKSRKMKYKPGSRERLPGYQFQRQNREVVEELWETLRSRYESADSPLEAEFEVESGQEVG